MSRKLKPYHHRVPKDKVTFQEFAKEISKETGFHINDVKEVFRVGLMLIIKMILKNKQVELPYIGKFFPVIDPPRHVMNMKGGTDDPTPMIKEASWNLRFKPGKYAKDELAKIKPSKEQIEDIYEE